MKQTREQRNKRLQESLEQKRKLLLANAKDAHFAGGLIDEIISLKGQLDVEPVELEVRTKDVIKEYDFNKFAFKVCRAGVMFNTKGGFSTFVHARCKSLYNNIIDMLGVYDTFDELEKEKKEIFNQYLMSWTHIFHAPVGASLSDNVLFETAAKYLEVYMREAEDLLARAGNTEATTEEIVEAAEQEDIETVLDTMSATLKEDRNGKESVEGESVCEEAEDEQQ